MLSARPAEKLDGGICDVFRVSFGGGSSYDYLLSPSDGRLFAIRSFVNGQTLLTSFEDWRMVDGVRMPFGEHVTGDHPSDASSIAYTSIEINPRLSDALFAMPSTVKPTVFADGASSSGWLPFEFFDNNRIFIPAVMNGHQTTVFLDSGASSTVIDQHFAESLGLRVEVR